MPQQGQQRSFDILVVGRGAIGAAAALGLAQAGMRVGWIGPAADAMPQQLAAAAPIETDASAPVGEAEQTPGFTAAAAPPADSSWDSRVFAISPASRELLQRLRVWDSLPADRIAPVYDMRVFAGDGLQPPELHLDAYRGRVDALAWIVENSALMRVLREGARHAGVTSIEDEVFALTADPPGVNGRVRLTLGSGHSMAARLVFAADGAHSAVRELSGISSRVREYPQTAVVANFDTVRPHGDTAYQWMGRNGVLALLPLPAQSESSGRCSMVWSAPNALAQTLQQLPPRDLAERVEAECRSALGPMTTITPARSFALQMLKVDRMIGPRVVLLGDAAHTMHPLAGQGMNVGFGDVSQALSVLKGREPYRDLADPLLWRRYERARREAVLVMQATTDGLQRLFGDVPAPLAALRHLGWRAVAASDWLRRRMIAQAVR
ncbi:MAG TPA: FAD-dependent monooxygenase [Burkholderiaceae bacterium]|nr:FAD-dependent monooxygenase [Burkholderiaceae bacterium]